MDRTTRVFLACAFGAFVGALMALSADRNFWWIGLIVGFVVGYISYEWREILRVIPDAWRVARSELQAVKGWRPDKQWWDAYARLNFEIVLFSINFGLPFYGMLRLFPLEGLNSTITFTIVFGFPLAMYLFLGNVYAFTEEENDPKRKLVMEMKKLTWQQIWKDLNPFNVYFRILPPALLHIFRKAWRMTIPVAAMVARFGWHFFREIHSDIRLLCGLDAALGAAVGYFFNNPVIGALAGGIIGVINYELVSKRWLAIVPPK